jgi:hypothetical protein
VCKIKCNKNTKEMGETQDTERLKTMAFPDVSTFCLAKERWSETV